MRGCYVRRYAICERICHMRKTIAGVGVDLDHLDRLHILDPRQSRVGFHHVASNAQTARGLRQQTKSIQRGG